MKTRPIYRAIVIGCPGSGKSTFARALHGLTGLPLYYLDMLRWDSSGSMIPTDVFHSRLAVAMQKDNWIIDGNCISTLEKRARQADTVFFLDYPLEVCLGGIRSRKGQPRPGMPFVPDDEADVEFMEYVRSFRDERRPQIPGTLSRHPEKQTLVFADRQEADTFLNSLSRRAN